LRDLNQQALKLVADAVMQHREIGPAAHLYFSQVQLSTLSLSNVNACIYNETRRVYQDRLDHGSKT